MFNSIFIIIGVAMLARFGALIIEMILTKRKMNLTNKIINNTLTDARQIPGKYHYYQKLILFTISKNFSTNPNVFDFLIPMWQVFF